MDLLCVVEERKGVSPFPKVVEIADIVRDIPEFIGNKVPVQA